MQLCYRNATQQHEDERLEDQLEEKKSRNLWIDGSHDMVFNLCWRMRHNWLLLGFPRDQRWIKKDAKSRNEMPGIKIGCPVKSQ